MSANKEGWSKPRNSMKWHYFKDGRSLCGKFGLFFETLEQGNDQSEDNCAACKRKVGAFMSEADHK